MTTKFRPALPEDESFIVSGWSSSYRMSRDLAFVQMETYADYMHPIIKGVLARPRVQTIVAHGEVLHGFLTFERSLYQRPPLVIYVYVAQPYRRGGDARGLFDAAGIDPGQRFEFACRTKMSWELQQLHRKAPLAIYNPYRARYAEEET